MSTLDFTDIKDISISVDALRTAFHTRQLDPVDVRIAHLKLVYNAINDNSDELAQALVKDFNRPVFETVTGEIVPVLAEIKHIIANLKLWAKPKYPGSVPLLPFLLTGKKIERIPLGTVLVISAFNYPLLLSVSPVVGAIAGGNNVLLKPSESTPHFTAVLSRVLLESVSPDVLQIVNGAVEETKELLQQKFDLIFYTGSGRVGKIVAAAAAQTLTPTVLELGGKSPAVVSASLSDAQLEIALRRIAWAKFSNAGQICVTTDYLLVDEKIYDKAIGLLKKIIEQEFFKDLTALSESYAHLIHNASYDRVLGLVNSTKATLVTGGASEKHSRFISPTVYSDVSWNDPLMQDEIFGPLLPVLKFTNLNKEIDTIIATHDTPLASYIYSNDKQEIDVFLKRVRSGGSFVNDAVMHVVLASVPFGGIGQSGTGNYHGKFSFDTFTHQRTVLHQKWWTESLYKDRYPPYSEANQKAVTNTFLPLGRKIESGRLAKWGVGTFIVGLFSLVLFKVRGESSD